MPVVMAEGAKTLVHSFQFQSARELFEAAREASRDAERIRRQLMAMESAAEGLGSPWLGQRVSATGEPDRMASRVAALVDREEMLRKRQDEDYAVIELANRVLYGEDNASGLWALAGWRADAIYQHYVNCLTWEVVARLLGYSRRHVWEQAQVALDMCDGWGLVSVASGMGGAES